RLDLPFYDYRKHEGWLRNLIIRVASTGQVMVNLVVQHYREELPLLLDGILEIAPEVTSLHYTLNDKLNDSIYDRDIVCYYGTPYIEEHLEHFRFKISPKSFFQTNTEQAAELYRVTRDFAGLTGSEVVYDLYCGTGSIGLFLSRGAKKIVGVDLVPEAIADARENAKLNGIEHAEFYAGDVTEVCTDSFFAAHGRPDTLITDPPRAGMHEALVKKILEISAPRVVYVSCNPATQARDLNLLGEKYEVGRVRPVDMFPHTHHIENVVQLKL